jgi:hypothetical protein
MSLFWPSSSPCSTKIVRSLRSLLHPFREITTCSLGSFICLRICFTSWAYRKEKIRGTETNLPDFSDFARQVPKTFFRREIILTTFPPPRRQKNFGQCTILGVQKFFGHTKIFRNILIFSILWNFPQNWQNLSHFFMISQYCPTVERILADWLCLPNKLGGGGGGGGGGAGAPRPVRPCFTFTFNICAYYLFRRF